MAKPIQLLKDFPVNEITVESNNVGPFSRFRQRPSPDSSVFFLGKDFLFLQIQNGWIWMKAFFKFWMPFATITGKGGDNPSYTEK